VKSDWLSSEASFSDTRGRAIRGGGLRRALVQNIKLIPKFKTGARAGGRCKKMKQEDEDLGRMY